ncbi:bifunctional 5,10-methylenetetrahydrofolate dehydrogenase/5,10-methenyltetrahydrofolate cyclohydrolase [Loigolactobacillus bifermentans]|uniref:bifunctional 5,10-methylenetetrahydrofolate dehydrogenase/5,10-methenyltetrahydrofolate cyclohydrolase n=1 Tax=Loigolactobacillus bifermentans TaxID=1607 RepID=UPI0009F895CB|nr:tetrahydrofolate dehydrogenase/cyclohydrolase catalytic domain-containing protein [Loigolactobacillus bifermentans]QGG59518.1 bifunctional methylenetetrahydrofolate dehydrogenase/methenyltetrahydrofolate cyclohydrolase [Loigolactobacillus bifermentans]
MVTILDGKTLAKKMTTTLKQRVAALQQQQIQPKFAVIIAGTDPASEIYLRNKVRRAERLGIEVAVFRFPANVTATTLIQQIQQLNQDAAIHAIMLEMPLPKQLDSQTIIAAIDPAKDADGIHPLNLGRILTGQPGLLPNTPYGIMQLLQAYQIPLVGANAVVVGRSTIVGKPIAALLTNQHATVTLAHSRTKDLTGLLQQADLIVAATGQPEWLHANAVKAGAVVIDVGMNQNAAGQLVGDVAYDDVAAKAGAITPVPGGVGPMTNVMLMTQIVALAEGSQANA